MAPLPSAGSLHLLVAEDEPHIRRVLTTLLDASGFQVEAVADGSEALAAVRSDRPFSLLILDIVLPGCSGLDVLREVRTLPHRQGLPVIILTAKGQDIDREQAFALGANAFMTKPFSPKKLLKQADDLVAPR